MKDIGIAYLLWFFLWFLGGHKFYLNKMGMGFFYLFTCGGFFIGSIIDLFTLSKQVREANILLMHGLSNYRKPVQQVNKKKPLTKQEKEKVVLQIAKKFNGRITPLEIAAESELSVDESEEILKQFSLKGYVDIKVNENGTILYEFSGFLNQKQDHLKGLLE